MTPFYWHLIWTRGWTKPNPYGTWFCIHIHGPSLRDCFLGWSLCMNTMTCKIRLSRYWALDFHISVVHLRSYFLFPSILNLFFIPYHWSRASTSSLLVQIFADMEELGVKPDEDTVRRVGRAFQKLGQEENRKIVYKRYGCQWKYIHFKGERVRVRRDEWDEDDVWLKSRDVWTLAWTSSLDHKVSIYWSPLIICT